MSDQNLTPSAEVNAMAQKERAKWLTIAEGQRVRKQWDETVQSLAPLLAKYDEDPENETEAMLLVLLSGLMVSGFMQTASNAANRMKELKDAS